MIDAITNHHHLAAPHLGGAEIHELNVRRRGFDADAERGGVCAAIVPLGVQRVSGIAFRVGRDASGERRREIFNGRIHADGLGVFDAVTDQRFLALDDFSGGSIELGDFHMRARQSR